MCGFAGASSHKLNAKANQSVKRMATSVKHRGPDGDGVFKSAQCHIAHRRLSIIDAQGGHQPLISSAGNMIAFNGMINNFLELKKELPDAEFETKSDTEVALKLYEQHGEKFVEKIRGMYALAIWDKAQETLILARDPYGIKPLYYCEQDGTVYFASEPHAFLEAGLLAPQLASEKALELLQLKFTTGPQTVYEGIYRVLPGEMLFVKHGKIIRRERHNPFAASSKNRTNFNDAYEHLDKHLVETAELYARSDVPFGVFLSGGVDSCAIIAALRKSGVQDYTCYTAHFPGSTLSDETNTAKQVAAAAGVPHICVPINEDDFWTALGDTIACVDDPSMDPAVVANYILAKRASEDVKVILGGDGGDEVFGGYRRYERALIPRFFPVKQMRHRGVFDKSGLAQFENLPWRNDYAETIEAANANTQTRLQALQATDGSDFLPHFHLMKFDRCLMAHGIEGRAPLLDQELARFGFNLPDRLKLRGQKGKWLVRKWLNDNMPEAKPFTRKRGFSVPVNDWIAARAPALADFICEQPGIKEVFHIDAVHKLFAAEHHTKSKYLWPILYYACWHQLHIQRDSLPDFSGMKKV